MTLPSSLSARLSSLEASRVSTPRQDRDRLSTGVARLDRLLSGGFPRGAISEIVGTESSGRTSLLFSTLAQATNRGETVAYIDTFDSLDPASARRSGVLLERLLWVRCRAVPADQKHAFALKAADILARSEGFGLVALDCDSPFRESDQDLRTPFSQWFRLKQLLGGKPVVFLLIMRRAGSGSAASLVLELKRSQTRWRQTQQNSSASVKHPPHTRLLRGISSHTRLLRGKKHGHVTVHCDF